MWGSRIPEFGTLLVLLARFTFPKPLPDWKEQHHEEESIQRLFGGQKVEGLTTTWNLSRASMPVKPKMKLPQYMIDLYNQYADDRTSMPMANIIRSFDVEEIFISSPQKSCTHSPILQFNVTIPKHELVTKAELKLKVSLGKWGFGHLSLFDVVHNQPSNISESTNYFLASKDVEDNESVTIDITKTVKRWIESEMENQKLNMILKAKMGQTTCAKSGIVGVSYDRSHPPILIIFSDDQGNHMKETKMELSQMILHEKDRNPRIFFKNATATHMKAHNEVWRSVAEGRTRLKRSTGDIGCHKASMMVQFKDIGWDSFILFPQKYDAGQCVGKCYYPITENMTPTKHAIIQALMHTNKVKGVDIPCCVPTKLEPLQVAYMENNKPVIITNYEGMKVAECGCR
ncbi:dorsalin-1-like [Aquarana catesbeiana]|uniref:dorsalin-1-like n=1 Tax=Aquarana catesbeiana TaxID=8400 RepID=UPI003CCA2EAB